MLEVQSKGAPWTYTIWRPPIVCGFAYNSPLNVMAAIGAHAAVLRELGQPLEYPGASPGQLNEVVDSRLIASALEWAAENCGEGGAAANQTFNITNGDTAAWEGIYPTIAAHFGMEMGEPAEDWSRDYLAKWSQVATTRRPPPWLSLLLLVPVLDCGPSCVYGRSRSTQRRVERIFE